MVAPSAPAAVTPTPSTRRRVTLPLYQNSSISCVRSSDIVFPPVDWLGSPRRDRLKRRLEGGEGPLDLRIAVRERDVEFLRCLDHTTPDQGLGERGVPSSVGSECGPVVRDRPLREVDLEHRRLARDLGLKAGARGRLLGAGL